MSNSRAPQGTLDKLNNLPKPTRLEIVKVIESEYKCANYSILYARNYEGQFLVLFPSVDASDINWDSSPVKISDGFSVRFRTLENKSEAEKNTYLELTSFRNIDITLLAAVIDEVGRSIDGDTSAEIIEVIRTVITRWKRVLTLGTGRRLSLAELIGLAGELLFLKHLVNTVPEFEFEFWTGPDGGIHDFEGPDYSIEVKTSTVPDANSALINGLWQLEEVDSKPLRLILIELKIDPNGESISDLYKEIVALSLRDTVEFEQKLGAVGVPVNALDQYSDFSFSVNVISIYRIDEHFPKLTFRSLNEIDLSGRVSDVTYRLNVEGLETIKGSEFPNLKSIIL
jgi:hypothetical protein